MRSNMEVNWENTMALAEGSLSSMAATSSRRASILVLLWNSPPPSRVRMLLRLLPTSLAAAACSRSMHANKHESRAAE